MSNYLGDKIKFHRKEKHFTQKALGELIGKSYEAIRKYENGERQPPIKVVQQISEVLGVPMNEFISEKTDKFDDFYDITLAEAIKEAKEIELLEQLLRLYGYKIKNVHPGGASTEEEAEAIAEDVTKPWVDITNSNNETITLTVSDWNLLTVNLKKFFAFELFKLK